MQAVADSSVLIALINTHESRHASSLEIIRQFAGRIVVPAVAIPEVSHVLALRRGHHVMRGFIRQLQNPVFNIDPFVSQDLARIDELLHEYADAELDFVDCAITSLAERLNISTILTWDRRDFSIIRPKHIPFFTILPE